MQLAAGFRLGVYEVTGPLGTGGMGEVYRARDITLGRDVALKVLPQESTPDPGRLSRFEREARAVAALSHPNILAIHSFGTDQGLTYAVMELLEGHTLREELAKGALPVRRATAFGSQIALGLAAAHEKEIIHRDLKPENVWVTSDGRIKILDFGIAAIVATPHAGVASDATRAERTTLPGMLVGSVGYMSPEQAAGTTIDHRTDVFSLGLVLFEMLSGRPAFRRDSALETLTATLNDDPLASAALTPAVPLALERIVRRCLEKAPSERFQSARDLAFALDVVTGPTSDLPSQEKAFPWSSAANRWLFVVAVTGIVSLWAAAVVGSRYLPSLWAREHPLVTFTIAPPFNTMFANVPSKMLAISPDGQRIVFAVESSGQRELWTRHLESTHLERLPGTHNASDPFWSPDGQHIGFFADSKLKRVSLTGEPVQTLCDAPVEETGATWSSEGVILFSDAQGGLSRVAATGGIPTRVTMPDQGGRNENDTWPQFLPDGRRFLYLRRVGPGTETGATVYLGTLGGNVGRPLLSGVFNASFVSPDLLLFADASTVKIQRVDLDRAQMTGEIEDVITDVDRHLGRAALAVSQTGTLAYASAGSRDSRLVWVDRAGHETGTVATPDPWRDIAISPDGSRVAVQRIVSEANDIWTIDLARGVPSRFTFSAGVDDAPVWSPDGKKIAFSSARDGVAGIYLRAISGVGDDELLFKTQTTARPSTWSPDGRVLLFDQTDPRTASDVWVLPLDGDRSPYRYLATPFSESDARFSPDGKWVAYTSDESGRDEVYIQSFPDSREKEQVSTGGGVAPLWSPGGRELYYLSIDKRLIAVQTHLGTTLQVRTPAPLFDTHVGLGTNRYAAAHDGKHFLLSLGTAESSAAPLVVVVNWAKHLPIAQRAR